MSDINAFINVVFLIAFTAGMTISTLAMIRRIRRFRRAGMTVPPLLWRDVYCFGTATITIWLLLAARVYGAFDALFTLRDETWWYLLTGIPTVSGILIWTWFELVYIPLYERRGESAYDNR